MTEPRRRHMMVRLAWIFYLPMIATAVFAKAPGALRVEDWAGLLQGAGTAVALGIGVVLLSRYLARNTEWGRALHVEFAAILVGLGSAEILALSLLSAFGEEILFRGVLHARLGLWPTALLFGAVHFPVRRRLVPWTLFAAALGVVLGVMTDYFQSLWPAILLHFMINYFNIHDLAEHPAGGRDASSEAS